MQYVAAGSLIYSCRSRTAVQRAVKWPNMYGCNSVYQKMLKGPFEHIPVSVGVSCWLYPLVGEARWCICSSTKLIIRYTYLVLTKMCCLLLFFFFVSAKHEREWELIITALIVDWTKFSMCLNENICRAVLLPAVTGVGTPHQAFFFFHQRNIWYCIV